MAVDYPLTLRHRDGTLTEVLYNASVYRDAGGKVLGVFAAVRYVTNQTQAHRTIAQQQATALDRLAELEQFHRLAVGRELQMIELKKETEHLKSLLPPDEAKPSPATNTEGRHGSHDNPAPCLGRPTTGRVSGTCGHRSPPPLAVP